MCCRALLLGFVSTLAVAPLAAAAVTVTDTGQTGCYDASNSVACPASGQPFFGQDGTVARTAASFTAGANTVTDNVHGLVWQKADDGTPRTFAAAQTYCDSLSLDGHSNFRLPNVQELDLIVDASRFDPSIFAPFSLSGQTLYLWSGTSSAASAAAAWLITFTYGALQTDLKTANHFVLCVEGTPLSTGSYTDSGHGTVVDADTQLEWVRADYATTLTWQAALAYCEALDFSGYTDWRLPDRNELTRMVDYSASNPACNVAFGAECSTQEVWSSTTFDAAAPQAAWTVSVQTGAFSGANKAQEKSARCVRTYVSPVTIPVFDSFGLSIYMLALLAFGGWGLRRRARTPTASRDTCAG